MKTLSDTAKSALLSMTSNRQGSRPTGHLTESVRRELIEAGMIGKGDGLTRAGSIARERLTADLISF